MGSIHCIKCGAPLPSDFGFVTCTQCGFIQLVGVDLPKSLSQQESENFELNSETAPITNQNEQFNSNSESSQNLLPSSFVSESFGDSSLEEPNESSQWQSSETPLNPLENPEKPSFWQDHEAAQFQTQLSDEGNRFDEGLQEEQEPKGIPEAQPVSNLSESNARWEAESQGDFSHQSYEVGGSKFLEDSSNDFMAKDSWMEDEVLEEPSPLEIHIYPIVARQLRKAYIQFLTQNGFAGWQWFQPDLKFKIQDVQPWQLVTLLNFWQNQGEGLFEVFHKQRLLARFDSSS